MGLQQKTTGWGWVPFTWLIYLGFLFLQPVFEHAGWRQWTVLGLVIVAFLALYFPAYHQKGRRLQLTLIAICGLGFAYLPFNSGASTFFVYAAALIPFAVETGTAAMVWLAIELAAVALECHLLRLPLGAWLVPFFVSAAVCVGNIYFAQQKRINCKLRMAQEEIEHLAKLAERERIARDMHDVLGHTLSLIVLKSELAGRVARADPERAASEMRDVEQTARAALAEVREAIGGYRSEGLAAEVKRAQRTLELAGVETKCEIVERDLAPKLTASADTVLSLALREAVTNIVRHAGARHCALRIAQSSGACSLSIEDDGRGGSLREGNGLRGMRERIEALGGSFACDSQRGTRLEIRVPLETMV
ncbi:MAG: sensor histidine kinase [Acidobacteriaceae bacterium]